LTSFSRVLSAGNGLNRSIRDETLSCKVSSTW
jgi:hypothetical protein